MKKFFLFLTVLLISAAFYGAGAAAHLDIAINIAETKEYSFFELDKVISLNPDVAQVKKLSDRAYSVTGVSRGSTFLIFWNYSGEKAAIKVNVSYPAPAVQDEGSLSKTDEESLKFGYNFFTYNGSSVSQYDFNRWSYSGLFHQLNASGQTPLGMTNSYIQYEGYNGRYGITKMALGFKTEKYYFNLGDSFADLSELTLPFLNYQGLYYNLTPNEYFELTAATGASANGLWGKSVWNDSRPKQTFGAVKLLVRPRRNLNFSLSAVTSSQEVTGQGSNILALGAMYRPFDRLTLQGEAANAASGGGAYKAEAAYTGDNLYLKGTYRSIGADYITPSDSVNWRGTDGFYLSGSYRPLSNVDIGFSSDRYINTYLQGPSSTFYNSDVKGSLRVRAGSGTVFTYSPWKEDRRGFASGGIGEGSITQLSHDFNFIVPNTVYARYEPTKFTQSNTVESDYVNDRMLMGLRLGVSQALSLNIERGWETRTLLYNLSQENTNFIRMLLNYNSKLGRTPLYTSVNSQYYNSTSASGTGLTEMWADAELGYELDQRAKAYVRGKVANYIGTGGSTADRCENHVSFGLKVLFDTGSKWKGLSYVSGHVFVDQNGDGIFSEGEKGIPGARILVGSRTVVTDRSGRYFVGAVTAGATKVKLDLSS
ncbi:MAG: pilus assembly protein N-terminal domain-containing protein, partial [Candidatus Margulisiibacteriota bacterium]